MTSDGDAMDENGLETTGLLEELGTIFQHIGENRFLYLPTKRVVAGGPEPALAVFAQHATVYFKFLARCKPKVSGALSSFSYLICYLTKRGRARGRKLRRLPTFSVWKYKLGLG
jgi:hypothetical protein